MRTRIFFLFGLCLTVSFYLPMRDVYAMEACLAPEYKQDLKLSDIIVSALDMPNPGISLNSFFYQALFSEDVLFSRLSKSIKMLDFKMTELSLILYIEGVQREIYIEGDFDKGLVSRLQVHSPMGGSNTKQDRRFDGDILRVLLNMFKKYGIHEVQFLVHFGFPGSKAFLLEHFNRWSDFEPFILTKDSDKGTWNILLETSKLSTRKLKSLYTQNLIAA